MSSTTDDKLWIICPICHKANPAGSHFCEHCWGASLDPDSGVTEEELNEINRKREAYLKRRKMIKIGIIGVSVFAVLLAIFLSIYNLTDWVVKPSLALNSNSMAGDWAMFHHDISLTGGTSGSIPQGTLKWSFQTGASVQSSPAVSNGTVYIGSQDSKLYALNADTGAKTWEYEAGSWVDSSPVVANGLVYFGSNDGYLYALNAQSGTKVWDFKTTFPVRSAPAVAGKMVYFGGDDYSLYALNAATGKEAWDYATASPVISPPVVANGIVYIGSADGFTYAFNALNGQRRLRFEIHYAEYGSPVVSGSTVYAVTTNGRLVAFNGLLRTRLQEHEIKPIWTQIWMMGIPGIPKPLEQTGYLWAIDLRGASNTSPVLSGNTLYVGLETKMSAVDLTTRKKLWTFTTKGTVRSSPALVNNILYFGSDDGHLYAVYATDDEKTGKKAGDKLWDFATGSPITSSPAVVNGVVYVGSTDGSVYAIK